MAKRKTASKPTTRKARPRNVKGVKKVAAKAEPSTNGTVSAKRVSKSKDVDPNQPNFPIMAEERCSSVEGVLKRHRDRLKKIDELKAEDANDTGKLPDLFKKHKLLKYTAAGFMVTIVPGAESVKFKKVKEA